MDEGIHFRLIKIEEDIAKILKLLNGNGKAGITTQLALHDEKIKNIPPPKALKFWAAVGGGIVSGLGLITWMIFQALKSAFSGS